MNTTWLARIDLTKIGHIEKKMFSPNLEYQIIIEKKLTDRIFVRFKKKCWLILNNLTHVPYFSLGTLRLQGSVWCCWYMQYANVSIFSMEQGIKKLNYFYTLWPAVRLHRWKCHKKQGYVDLKLLEMKSYAYKTCMQSSSPNTWIKDWSVYSYKIFHIFVTYFKSNKCLLKSYVYKDLNY